MQPESSRHAGLKKAEAAGAAASVVCEACLASPCYSSQNNGKLKGRAYPLVSHHVQGWVWKAIRTAEAEEGNMSEGGRYGRD